MAYKIVFVGLANFCEVEPQGRVVLLPDGRMPPHGIAPHYASILVNGSEVERVDNWEPVMHRSGAHFYAIDEPSEITLSGMESQGTGRARKSFEDAQFTAAIPQLKHFAPGIEVVPREAQTIAQILISAGRLEARWFGRSLVAQLTVDHDGPVRITAITQSTVRKLELAAGAEFFIFNTANEDFGNVGHDSAFPLYGMLDVERRMDKLAEVDIGELQRPGVPRLAMRNLYSLDDYSTPGSAITATSIGDRRRRAARQGGGDGRRAAASPAPRRPRRRGRGVDTPTFDVAPPDPPAATPASMEQEESAPEIPREFYGLFDAPSDVENDVKFKITAGITAEAQSDDDAKIVVPENITGAFDLTLSIQAPAFKLPKNIAVFTLSVTSQNPYPTIEITAKAQGVARETPQTFAIDYSIAGQAIGSVERTITVHPGANDKTRNAAQEKLRRAFSISGAQQPPDLTVFIRYDHAKTLSWTLITPHQSVVTPIDPITSEISGNPKDFSKNLITNANTREGQAGLYEYLVGTGSEIRKVMPVRFWSVLAEVAEVCGKDTPSLLIISNEPYIPWELATFDPDDDEPPHPELAPFLGVQVTVGRWLIGERVPPPVAHSVRQSYVLSGEYNIAKWNRLVNAEEEAKEISAVYGATQVEAKQAHILGIFVKQPAADLIHFSMHGKSNEDSVEDGLIPIDGGAVKAQMITGAIEEAKKQQRVAPFVFLNACQVGAGQKILGDYGGMAEAFINGGAAGVVAPLWSVKDDDAKKIALEFYRATLTAGNSPAEAMRQARAQFIRKEDAPVSATYLAYQFFGHPSLRLRKEP